MHLLFAAPCLLGWLSISGVLADGGWLVGQRERIRGTASKNRGSEVSLVFFQFFSPFPIRLRVKSQLSRELEASTHPFWIFFGLQVYI